MLSPHTEIVTSIANCTWCGGEGGISGSRCPNCGGNGVTYTAVTLRELAEAITLLQQAPPPPGDVDAPVEAELLQPLRLEEWCIKCHCQPCRCHAGLPHRNEAEEIMRDFFRWPFEASRSCSECGAADAKDCACRR